MQFTDTVVHYSIDSIDEIKTAENGKIICCQYRPLIEKRIKRLLTTPMNSTSIVAFTNGTKSRNSFENKLIERVAWNDDQVTNFINNILLLEKIDKEAGLYLKLKYIYDKTDKEIANNLKITPRTLRRHKFKAYFQIAVWSNKIEYIYCKTFHFAIDLT